MCAAHKGNKYALGNKGGVSPMYESKEALENTIQEYFDMCIEDKEKATVTGLTLYLGFESRSSLDDYKKKNNEFSYIIKRAKLAVENAYEVHGQTIDIFALKNMGWKDHRDIDLKDERRTLDNEQREERINELKKKLGVKDE